MDTRNFGWNTAFRSCAAWLSWRVGLDLGAIAPFRRLVVHPAIIRTMQSAWAARYGEESGVERRSTV